MHVPSGRAAARRAPTCSTACALSPAPRARARDAKIIAVTGSVGKTGTKEALRLALSRDGETHASAASYNNHWGVPLSLARCPASAKYAVFEIGMNHAGEIAPLSQAGAAACRDHHHDRAGASRISSRRSRRSPTPRRRSSPASSRAAPRSSTATTRISRGCSRSAKAARRRAHRLVRRARQGRCAADQVRAAAGLSRPCRRDILGARRHLQARRARPPSRAEFARRAGGGDARRRRSRARGAGAGRISQPPTGRGARMTLDTARRHGAADRRKLQRQSGLDARGARAARPGAGRAARPAHRRARRHAGTRRPSGADLHAAWPTPVVANARRSRVLRGPADAGTCGRLFPPSAGAAMPRQPRRSKPLCSARSAPATR